MYQISAAELRILDSPRYAHMSTEQVSLRWKFTCALSNTELDGLSSSLSLSVALCASLSRRHALFSLAAQSSSRAFLLARFYAKVGILVLFVKPCGCQNFENFFATSWQRFQFSLDTKKVRLRRKFWFSFEARAVASVENCISNIAFYLFTKLNKTKKKSSLNFCTKFPH